MCVVPYRNCRYTCHDIYLRYPIEEHIGHVRERSHTIIKSNNHLDLFNNRLKGFPVSNMAQIWQNWLSD